MKKTMAVLISVLLVVLMAETGAFAAWYSDDFPSNNSTVVATLGFIPPFSYGYFYSATLGHKVEQTFTNTGLESVVGLELNLVVTEDTLTSPLGWNVFVNDTFVGNWFQRPIDGTGPKLFEFVFPDIVGHDTYTIAMEVRADVPDGEGSIALGFPTGPMLLVGCACICPVPIPGAVWFLGTGLVGLLGIRRKLRG